MNRFLTSAVIRFSPRLSPLVALLPLLFLVTAVLPPATGQDKKAESKKLPLESIYSTSGQKGLKKVWGAGDNEFLPGQLHQSAMRVGASNVFLVDGANAARAIHATMSVFMGGVPVDDPVPSDRLRKSDLYWMVAYFGVSGSDPPAWQVKSAEISNKTIRLTFTSKGALTNDEHPYFVWVPAGNLEPGTYTLELFDEGEKQVTLLRRVTIPKK